MRCVVPAAALLLLPLIGCGAAPARAGEDCQPVGFQMLITSFVTVAGGPDHLAAAPGNQQQFIAGLGSTYGPGCVSNQLYRSAHAQWTVSDTANVTISSSDDESNGIATCLGTTTATVTGTLSSVGLTESRIATISCK